VIYLLLLLSTILSAGKALSCKKIGVTGSSFRELMSLNAGVFAVATLCVLVTIINKTGLLVGISAYSLGLSVAFASVMVFTQITQAVAMSRGSSSATVLVYSCGFLLPIVWSSVFYDENITYMQIAGVAVLIISLYFIISPSKDSKLSFVWLVFAVMSMVGSGVTAIIQKIHQHSPYAYELRPFLVYTFFFCALFCLLLTLLTSKETQSKSTVKERVSLSAVSGLFVGILNILNLTLAGKIPAVVLFPVYNVGGMILTGIMGTLIFKEKNTPKQLLGFGIGCVAIIIIGVL